MSKGRKVAAGVGIILLSGVAALNGALQGTPVPQASSFQIDWPALRELSRDLREPLPVQLRGMEVARGKFPAFGVVAGSGWGMHPMFFGAHQVVYPKGARAPVIIDTVFNQTMHAGMSLGEPYFPENWDRLQKAMQQASAIVLTHEHPDHLGGAVQSPFFARIAPRLQMTVEQLEGPSVSESGMTNEQRAAVKPIRYEQMMRVAPGVVVIKAPGHSPGSQMVFVMLQNGLEFLFVGDTVWWHRGIEKLSGRPWLAQKLIREDGEQVAEQIRFLHDLERRVEPGVHVVVAHDGEQFARYVREGWVHEGF